MRKKPITAAELTDELRNDPVYIKLRSEQDRRLQLDDIKLTEDETELCADLRAAGRDVKTLWELVNEPINDITVVKVLLSHVTKVRHLRTKEGIVRALTVPAAKGMVETALVEEFGKTTSPALRWAIGSALEFHMTKELLPEVLDLISKSDEQSRQMLILALAKVPDARSVEALKQLLATGENVGHAIVALGKLRERSARALIRPQLTSKNAWIASEAKKALQRIDEQ
jgi:hypothetical protein